MTHTATLLGLFLSTGLGLADQPKRKLAIAIEKPAVVRTLEEARAVSHLHRAVTLDHIRNIPRPTLSILKELATKREIRSLTIKNLNSGILLNHQIGEVLGEFKKLRHLAIDGFGNPESPDLWRAIAAAKRIETLHVRAVRLS